MNEKRHKRMENFGTGQSNPICSMYCTPHMATAFKFFYVHLQYCVWAHQCSPVKRGADTQRVTNPYALHCLFAFLTWRQYNLTRLVQCCSPTYALWSYRNAARSSQSIGGIFFKRLIGRQYLLLSKLSRWFKQKSLVEHEWGRIAEWRSGNIQSALGFSRSADIKFSVVTPQSRSDRSWACPCGFAPALCASCWSACLYATSSTATIESNLESRPASEIRMIQYGKQKLYGVQRSWWNLISTFLRNWTGRLFDRPPPQGWNSAELVQKEPILRSWCISYAKTCSDGAEPLL